MCLLNWSYPEDDVGSEITGFIIERKDAKMHTWRQPIETERSKCDITGLLEGQEYMFRVIAKNKFGCGPPVEIGPILAVDPLGKRKFCVYKVNIDCLQLCHLCMEFYGFKFPTISRFIFGVLRKVKTK